MAIPQQLALDDDLSDVRLDALDGIDFQAAPAPACVCSPHGLHVVTDSDGAMVCWACGRQVAPVTDLKPRSRVRHGGTTPVQGARCRRALQADPSGEGR